jgi:hypothetical protein
MDWAWDISLITNVFRIIRTIPVVVANMPGWGIVMWGVLMLMSLRGLMRLANLVEQRRKRADELEREMQAEAERLQESEVTFR